MPTTTFGSTTPPASFTGVYTFGDSTVDAGNDLKVADVISNFPFVSLPNGAPTADKGYFEGRFSNGFNFADLVSNKLVAHPNQPTFPYGVTNLFGAFSIPFVGQPSGNNLNFAYGGATVLPGSEPIPSLHAETSVYSNFTPDPNALYVISMGANDVLKLVPTGGAAVTGAQATSTLSSVAQTISQEVADLIARGARHVVVADVPDVAVTPSYVGANDAVQRSLLTQYVQTVNSNLSSDLAALTLPAGATVTDYDFSAYTDAVTANPAAYGFSNITQALSKVQPNAPDPTGAGFLFFDNLHPTAQAHAQIAADILNAVEHPGTPHNWTQAANIGAQASASLAAGASDAFTVTLTQGHTYVIDALGISSGSGTLPDPTVRVIDGAGQVVAQSDDGGLGLDSHLQFTASASGTYQVVVSGVGAAGAGSFRLQVGDTTGANLLSSGQLVGSDEFVSSGPGADTLTAASGSNTLFGGQGNDLITGGTGFDNINGNKGDDTIVGHSQVGDWLSGGQGDDSIAAQSSAHNLIFGNLGNDTLMAGSGGDTLRGGQGDDSIAGGAGADWISGDRGSDTVSGGAGADIFHSAPGMGTMTVTDFNAGEGDRVLLDTGTQYATSQVGADVHLDITGGGQIVLQNVQLTSLGSGWLFLA